MLFNLRHYHHFSLAKWENYLLVLCMITIRYHSLLLSFTTTFIDCYYYYYYHFVLLLVLTTIMYQYYVSLLRTIQITVTTH